MLQFQSNYFMKSLIINVTINLCLMHTTGSKAHYSSNLLEVIRTCRGKQSLDKMFGHWSTLNGDQTESTSGIQVTIIIIIIILYWRHKNDDISNLATFLKALFGRIIFLSCYAKQKCKQKSVIITAVDWTLCSSFLNYY